jgi:polyisoprenoid-binding protein YceI
MKRKLVAKLMLISAITLPFTVSAQSVETYQLDPSHTYILWEVNHFGFSNQVGKFTMLDGSLTLDEKKPQNSKVTVTININDLSTGVSKLDEHLKGKDFFDVQKYPTATFVSNKVEKTGENSAKVYGTLTLLGVSKPVTLNMTLNKTGMHPISHKKSMGFSGTTTFNRSEFGMSYGLPAVSDKVKIDIGAEANLAS